jgi:hypothetical protein
VTCPVYGKNSVVSFSWRGCRVVTRPVYGKNSFVTFSWRGVRVTLGAYGKNFLERM